MGTASRVRPLLALPLFGLALFAGGAVRRIQDTCGPFTDVTPLYCPYVLEAYYTGITAGTSATTFSPDLPITRAQSAVFTTKALNQALARGSRRAALGQWWATSSSAAISATAVGSGAFYAAADGADVWTANLTDGSVSRVRASDGRLLDTWTGAPFAGGVLVAMGRVFAIAGGNPGKLYVIDPAQPAGSLTSVADLGNNPLDLAFDGSRLWVANAGSGGQNSALTIVQPGTWTTTTVGGFQGLGGILFDGSNIWVTDNFSLLKLDSAGTVIQTITFPIEARFPVFDGANIWVPTSNGAPGAVQVVQASTGTVLQTLTPPAGTDQALLAASFDGQRVLVTDAQGSKVYVWNAASLAFIGAFDVPASAFRACSDGINFWLPMRDTGQLARF
jgi:DNA-binding beta-propeller fold protein YncE